MKRTTGRASLLVVAFSLAAAQASADGVTTLYTGWTEGTVTNPNDYSWTDENGASATFKNDGTEWAVVTNLVWNQNFGFNWNVYGLCLDSAVKSYAEGAGAIKLGAGGLKITKSGSLYALAGTSSSGRAVPRLILTANQTWEGPATGSASFGTGDDGHNAWSEWYHQGIVSANADVTSWTLKKGLNLWMFLTNRIAHVDVRVEDPARIFLPTKWTSSGNTGKIVTYDHPTKLGARSLTLAGDAVMWTPGKKTTEYFPMIGGTQPYPLNPTMDAETVAETLVLEGGADIDAAGATWDIPALIVDGAAGKDSSLCGSMTVLRQTTAVELRNGGTLDFAGTIDERGVSAGFSVTGTGKVRVTAACWNMTGALDLGENVDLEIADVAFGATVTGGRTLIYNPGSGKSCGYIARIYNQMSDKKIVVKSGTLYLPPMSRLPAEATIEIAADAAVVFSSGEGLDATRITGAGAANHSVDETVVTDDPVTEAEVVVLTNEVKRIFGSGLTSATTVRLAGGTLRFEASATVESPILVKAGSFIEACESCVATVKGKVTCDCWETRPRTAKIPLVPYSGKTGLSVNMEVTGLWTLGPGTTVFAGGADFSRNYDRLTVTREARVNLTRGTYSFGGRGDPFSAAMVLMLDLGTGADSNYGRHLCVKDGGSLTFAAHPNINECVYVMAPKNGGALNTSPWNAVFEIGEGGTVTIPQNGRIRFGSVDTLTKLRITGGTLDMDAPAAMICIGNGGATVTADIELSAGTLTLGSPIMRWVGSDGSQTNRLSRGHFVWTGGTLKLGKNFTAATIFDMHADLKASPYWQVNGLLRQSMQINGDDCVLDLSEMGVDSVANVAAGLDEAEWYGTGTLTVTGGKEFVMNALPNAISFKLADEKTRVTVPDAAFVYDNEECLKHRVYKDYDFGKPYSVTNKALNAALIKTLTAAGTNTSFAVTRTDLPITVSNAVVTGEWNNARTLKAVAGANLCNMTFSDGSTLAVAAKNGATVCETVDGMLMLPKSLFVRAARDSELTPTGAAALWASGGIIGTPVWLGIRGCQAENDGTTVRVFFPGLSVILR